MLASTNFRSNLKGAYNVNWKQLASKLPTSDSELAKKRRNAIWREMDVNSNGYLSLAEVDKGIRDILMIQEIYSAKPVMMRAFMSANNVAKAKNKFDHNYVQRSEFRVLLNMLRLYYEFYAIFNRIDTSDDRRITQSEFAASIPILNKFGVAVPDPLKEFKLIDTNNGGMILFEEFCDWAMTKQMERF